MLIFRKSFIGVLTGLFILTCFCSCGAENQKEAGTIMTSKKGDQDKIQVTMSLKYSIYLDTFEKAAEEKFPQLDLIQVGNFTSNYSDEYAQQLRNDDLSDIIVTWPLDEAALDCEERLIDLSGMEFTSRYNISMLNGIAKEGSLYYLPGPTQVRGILCNKTMFDENGWKLPRNYEEFIALCQQIDAAGIRALQLSFWNQEVLRHAFTAFGYGESFASLPSQEALSDYRAGNGSIGDFAASAFTSYQQMIDAHIFRKEDLEVRYPNREQMFYDRQCAMISDGIALIPAARKAGNHDEFAVIPFFSPGDNGSWGHMIPTQYIGMNKNLTTAENKEKYDLVLQIMDYISTTEGQLALADNNASMVSSLLGSPAPNAPELIPMREVIAEGKTAVFPNILSTDAALYEALASMLRGEITAEEAAALIDQANTHPVKAEKAPVIGQAAETFTLTQTGSFVTDVLREREKTDLALFLDNGKDGHFNARGISAKFYKGEIRESDVINRVLPVLQHGENGYLNVITISGENLIKALEYSLEDEGWFYYFSGLQMTYDPEAEPGSRIVAIKDELGNPIDPQRMYSAAVMEGSVDPLLITTCETTEIRIQDMLIEAIKELEVITPVSDGRFLLP